LLAHTALNRWYACSRFSKSRVPTRASSPSADSNADRCRWVTSAARMMSTSVASRSTGFAEQDGAATGIIAAAIGAGGFSDLGAPV